MSDMSPPATTRCPDHSTCRHCSQPITWDEYCYTHDSNGMADCGVVLTSGTPVAVGVGVPAVDRWRVSIDPTIVHDPAFVGKRAEPIEWNTPA